MTEILTKLIEQMEPSITISKPICRLNGSDSCLPVQLEHTDCGLCVHLPFRLYNIYLFDISDFILILSSSNLSLLISVHKESWLAWDIETCYDFYSSAQLALSEMLALFLIE